MDTRGLARQPGQSFADLYHERRALYQAHANITIDCSRKKPEQIINEIIGEEAEAYTEEDA